MKRILGIGIAALLVAAPAIAQAGEKAAAAATAPMTQGEVRKVDKDQKKITVKHGEIKNLEMPPMTMVFRVKDATLLDKVKAGDKIAFSAEKVGGNLTITQIEAGAAK